MSQRNRPKQPFKSLYFQVVLLCVIWKPNPATFRWTNMDQKNQNMEGFRKQNNHERAKKIKLGWNLEHLKLGSESHRMVHLNPENRSKNQNQINHIIYLDRIFNTQPDLCCLRFALDRQILVNKIVKRSLLNLNAKQSVNQVIKLSSEP
jgi:hypothetical protein